MPKKTKTEYCRRNDKISNSTLWYNNCNFKQYNKFATTKFIYSHKVLRNVQYVIVTDNV